MTYILKLCDVVMDTMYGGPMYKIIIDSCGELSEEMKKAKFCNVPLILQIEGEDIVDDESFDQLSFIKKVAASEEGPKSACPAPGVYLEEMEGEEERVYVVTLSSQLSGSYNSAVVAKDMYYSEHEDEDVNKKIHVFDSKSASIGETLIGLKIEECEKAGMSFEQIIETVDGYIAEQHTFFVLETLETFRKTGRISWQKEKIASVLNIKPIMGSTDIGGIEQLAKARGMASAMDKMVECLASVTVNIENKIVAISHCNCPERAEDLKRRLLAKVKCKDVLILNMRGVSTMYANDGGLIMVV